MAFTLAEVLITLGIIGVVAAITMPTLIQNHQKSVYVNQLKKTFSVISQGIQLAKVQDGIVPFEDTTLYSLINSEASKDEVSTEVQKYFKIIKFCKDDCFFECKALNGNNYCPGPEVWTGYNFILSDGAIVSFHPVIISHHTDGMMDIVIDVNGTKGPNQYGRDIFRLAVDAQDKVVPWDDMGPSGTCYINGYDGDPCVISNHGWCCAQRIIADGWKMNY